MENEEGLKINSNFPLISLDSWEDMPLNDFFRNKLQELNLKVYPTHRYGLGPILNGESILMTSPSGTYRSSLSVIGMIHTLDYTLKALQAIVLIPRKTLIDEYCSLISNYTFGLGLKIMKIIGSEKFNKKDLAKVQVAICSPGKLHSLLKSNSLNLNSLKIVTLDVANGLFYRDLKIQTDKVLSYLPKDVIYWYLSPICDENTTESYTQIKPLGKIINILDERVFHVMKFYFKYYEDEEDQFSYILKKCEEFNGQIIIFSCDIDELVRVHEHLKQFSPLFLHDLVEESKQPSIREEFNQGNSKILVCHGSFHFVRKIFCKGGTEIINLDIPPPDLLVARARRSNFTENDKFICFFKTYEDEKIKELEIAKDFKFLDISYIESNDNTNE